MSVRTLALTDTLYDYLIATSLREPDILRRLRDETATMPVAGLQIAPEQGQFMALLVELIGARRYLEIGTFTGYSALRIALAMPPEGRIVACDISEEWTGIARRYWREAGVADRIDLRLGPARETLAALIAEGASGTFDFAFVDADRPNLDAYFEAALSLVRAGGIVAVDNAFRKGRVADPSDAEEDTVFIRALGAKLHHDERITLSLVPIGDGLTLARKRN